MAALQLGIKAGVQQVAAPIMEQMASIQQRLSGMSQQQLPMPQQPPPPQQQPPAQQQLLCHQPEPLADGTLHPLPSELYTAAVGQSQPEPEPPAVQQLPIPGAYPSMQLLCEAWFSGVDGHPPLKDLPPVQRCPKQRWSDWGTFMAYPAQLMAAGQTLEQAAQDLERDRVEFQQARYDKEEAKHAANPKGKGPKRPALTVSGFVRHKTKKQRWDA